MTWQFLLEKLKMKQLAIYRFDEFKQFLSHSAMVTTGRDRPDMGTKSGIPAHSDD
jgi:hypothetical protein